MSKVTLEIQQLLNDFTRIRREIKDETQRLYEQGIQVETEEDDIFKYVEQLFRLEMQMKAVLKQMLADDFSPADAKTGLEKIDVLTAINTGSKHGDQLTRFLIDLNKRD
jgi:hypothetical protein